MPDKLYINKYMIRPGMLHPAEFPPDNPEEEYIRKDSLWKPTPEQLEAMECAIIIFEGDGYNTIPGYLKEIYNQIKKL